MHITLLDAQDAPALALCAIAFSSLSSCLTVFRRRLSIIGANLLRRTFKAKRSAKHFNSVFCFWPVVICHYGHSILVYFSSTTPAILQGLHQNLFPLSPLMSAL